LKPLVQLGRHIINAVFKVVAYRAVYNDTNIISELTFWDRSLRYMRINRGLSVECLEVHIMKILKYWA
jgi:hypothetical protein